jgi:hypothetical protein
MLDIERLSHRICAHLPQLKQAIVASKSVRTRWLGGQCPACFLLLHRTPGASLWHSMAAEKPGKPPEALRNHWIRCAAGARTGLRIAARFALHCPVRQPPSILRTINDLSPGTIPAWALQARPAPAGPISRAARGRVQYAGRRRRREEAALQLLASPHGLRGFRPPSR